MRLAHVLTAALTVAGLVAPATGALAALADSGAGRARRLERPDDEPDRLIRIVMNRKARLGIKVNLQARDTDSLGAYVESVSPNGPAAKAGLRSGDVITKLDGQSVLTGGEADEDADTRQSLPGLRLIELAARLQPADTVPIEFLRGKGRKTVSVITEKEPDSFAEMPGGERPFTMRFHRPGTDRDWMPLPTADLMDIGDSAGPGQAMAGFAEGILRGRPATPDDLVGTALFLASSDSDYLTGQVIMADGGMVLV